MAFRRTAAANPAHSERYSYCDARRPSGLLLALVSKLSTAARRLVLGRPFRSDKLSHTLLPKRIALPVFASDALSSVAYAPEEIFLVLSVAGLAAYSMAPWIGLAVAAVMLIVIASYRQNVHAYPSGGGDYEVVTTNLGPTAGLTVASALLVDYVLTVAVSMASAMSNIGSAVPFVDQHKVWFAVVAILVLASLNLRGIRESGTAFAIPTYAFMIGMYVMLGLGVLPDLRPRPPAACRVGRLRDALRARRDPRLRAGVPGRAGVLVGQRGADRRRGDQQRRARRSGSPSRATPQPRCCCWASIAITLFMGIIMLAKATGVQIAERPHEQLIGAPAGLPPEDADRAARRRGVPRLPDRPVPDRRRHRADPGAGRQHRVQRLPGAGIDSGAGPLPAPPAAHPRRPAGVLQRHPVPGLRCHRVHRGVPGRGHRADPALHRRGVRIVHAQPDRHGPALDPAAAHRDRRDRRAAG